MSSGIAKHPLGKGRRQNHPWLRNTALKFLKRFSISPTVHCLNNKIERDRTQAMSPEGRTKALNWPVSNLDFNLERVIHFRLFVAHTHTSTSYWGEIFLILHCKVSSHRAQLTSIVAQLPMASMYTCNVVMLVPLLTVWEMVMNASQYPVEVWKVGRNHGKGQNDLSLISLWILTSDTSQGGEDQGNPQLHLSKSQTSPLPKDFFLKPNRTATLEDSPGYSKRIMNSGFPSRYPGEILLEKEIRDEVSRIYMGYNFSLKRMCSLIHEKDLILLNYIKNCIGHCSYLHIVKSNM